MVTHRRPAHGVAQRRLVGFEKPALEFDIPARSISHVAHMDPEIERPPILLHPSQHAIMNRPLSLPARSAVTQNPEAVGSDGPGRGWV